VRKNVGPKMSGIKPSMNASFNRTLKHEIRGKIQQKFDLWITELWVRLGLSWAMLYHTAYKDIWQKCNDKYHLEHSSVYSIAKLPMLFDQVKTAVDKLIQKEVLYTIGWLSNEITRPPGKWIQT
jgi:hypothetical protein